MVRSLGMAQTLLRAEQVDDLVARYRDGATLVQLASRFGIHRRTVAEHLTRREVPIRRTGIDSSRFNEVADLYDSGLTLAEVGLKVGAGPDAVRRALVEHGVPIRAGGGRRSRTAAAS
jgi:lambda repressor-like predicted transcriptional regulator